jgi:MFS family permease
MITSENAVLRARSGRKWVMIFAICVFLFGSVLWKCLEHELAGRGWVVQGFGGGGCFTLAFVIISNITTLWECSKFLATGAFAWALGTNIGVQFSSI